ncbi:hypothetical protein BKA80DRAFT_262653 [Phyllosticta citrichinensis]
MMMLRLRHRADVGQHHVPRAYSKQENSRKKAHVKRSWRHFSSLFTMKPCFSSVWISSLSLHQEAL